jgi:2-polyprenyl-3-methyl-5-hydroxy-6-metoxy-1,4-benzoquinol methylase
MSRFDAEAAKWDSNPGRVALARAVADAMIRHIQFSAAMCVMDYGAGTGLITLRLQPLVASIVAADSSRGMLKVLDEKRAALGSRNIATRLLDLGRSEPTGPEFDAVVSSMTLHHVDDVFALFRRFRDALKPRGYLAVADLDTEDGTFHSDPTGVRHHGFEREHLCGLLGKAGFQEMAAHDAHKLQKPGKDGLATYSVFLITARR